MDDTKTRILMAAIRAVRLYGLEGARVQNISELAGLSPGALYRYFDSKDQLMEECFILVDKQAAAIFDGIRLNPLTMLRDPMGAVKTLWQPYFRFWLPGRTRRFSTIGSGTAPLSRSFTNSGI